MNKAYWCHECEDFRPVTQDADSHTFQCETCGETILCDHCGRAWADNGLHDSGPACNYPLPQYVTEMLHGLRST